MGIRRRRMRVRHALRNGRRSRLDQLRLRLPEPLHRPSRQHPRGGHQYPCTLDGDRPGQVGRSRRFLPARARQPDAASTRPGPPVHPLRVHHHRADREPSLPRQADARVVVGGKRMIRKPRGGALLASLIVIGVISLVTVAPLQLANISKQQAAKAPRSLSQVACVEAARQYMLSRLRLFGAPATAIKLDQAITVDNGTKSMRTGHANGPVINSVLPLQGSYVGGAKAGERSNVVGTGLGLGATAYRAVVACTDPQAGDMELEFTFQFGL